MNYYMHLIQNHVILFVIILLSGPGLLMAHDGDPVTEAYLLRMEGNLDSAKTILEQTLEKHPENALAWFELYRSYEHMRNGDPAKITDTEQSEDCLQKAIENDQKNPHYIYLKANLQILKYYIKLMTGDSQEDLGGLLEKSEKLYLQAVNIDLNYMPGLLTLVEFYAQMPPEMGGDPNKAEKYIKQLQDYDFFLGAKAQSMKLSKEENEIDYWKGILDKTPDDARVFESLGRAYLLHERNSTKAMEYFDKCLLVDPSKSNLHLLLGRFHMMELRQNYEKRDSILPLVEDCFRSYLDKSPNASNVMKAWIYSKVAQGKMHVGLEEEGEKLMGKARELDSYFPIAFAAPKNELPPREAHKQIPCEYYLRPF